MNFTHKLIAVINKDIEQGIAMNALAHMSLGLGADVGKELLRLDVYQDADQNLYPNISQLPFIILRGKSNEIKKTVLLAREHKIIHTAFLNTMTGGSYLEQLEKTRNHQEQDLIYYGCVLFGEWETVATMTKKFSLWRG